MDKRNNNCGKQDKRALEIMDLTNDNWGYEQRRIAWRAALDDVTVRSLASDYRKGLQDESTYDAFLEYRHRFYESNIQLERCIVHVRGVIPESCPNCRVIKDPLIEPMTDYPNSPLQALEGASPEPEEVDHDHKVTA